MKVFLAAFALLVMAASCSRLETLPLEPPIAPEAWLSSQPHAEFSLAGREIVLTQPSSTLIVYGLSLLTIGVGVSLLARGRRAPRNGAALGLWGLALIVWGIGTLAAGTSYQAFGYELKAEGRAAVLYTDAWELAYMALTVASVALMGFAVASSSTRGAGGLALRIWSALSASAYFAFEFAGYLRLDRFMLSFEAMVLFVFPSMLAFFAVNLVSWLRRGDKSDLLLVGAWIGMALVVAVYFAAYMAGLGEAVSRLGLWFNENDILHVGLVVWMLYLGLKAGPALAA